MIGELSSCTSGESADQLRGGRSPPASMATHASYGMCLGRLNADLFGPAKISGKAPEFKSLAAGAGGDIAVQSFAHFPFLEAKCRLRHHQRFASCLCWPKETCKNRIFLSTFAASPALRTSTLMVDPGRMWLPPSRWQRLPGSWTCTN